MQLGSSDTLPTKLITVNAFSPVCAHKLREVNSSHRETSSLCMFSKLLQRLSEPHASASCAPRKASHETLNILTAGFPVCDLSSVHNYFRTKLRSYRSSCPREFWPRKRIHLTSVLSTVTHHLQKKQGMRNRFRPVHLLLYVP